MMKSYIKNSCVIFSIVFSVLTLIHFFRGKELAVDVVWPFIYISFFSAMMTFLLRDNEQISNRRVMINQLIYLGSIMIMVVGISYFFRWEVSVFSVSMNLIVVIGIYVLVKYLLFTEDNKDAQKMNEALKGRRDNSD